MKKIDQAKSPLLLEKVLLYLLLMFYGVLAVLTIKEQSILVGFCSTINDCITFYSLRFSLIVGIIVLSIVRTKKGFYVPLISEMTEKVFWGMALLLIILIQPLVPYKSEYFSQYPNFIKDIKGFGFILFTYVTLHLLVAFQQQVWALYPESIRQKRIKRLLNKARLDNTERDYILMVRSKVLDEIALNYVKTPKIWKFSLFIVSIVAGAVLSFYAKSFVDLLDNYISLENLIPPY